MDQVSQLGEQYPELQSMARDEFEELVRRAEDSRQPQLPVVESSVYHAHLDSGRLAGSAELQVCGKPQSRSLLRWAASDWSILGARWDSEQATIGYAGAGELGLVVEPRDLDTLHLDWSAPSHAPEPGQRFDLSLPPTQRGELNLELPRGLVPRAAGCLVSGPSVSPRPELQRWQVRWSVGGTLRLELQNQQEPEHLTSELIYQRNLDVDVSEEGTEILARFPLTVLHQPVQRLELESSPGVKLFGWAGVKVRDWVEQQDRLVLELAEPLLGEAEVTVQALGPRPVDQQWTLPTLKISRGLWVGGRTALQAVPGLTLYDVQVRDGQPVATSTVSADRPEITIEHFSASSKLSARVSPELAQVFATVHTTVRIGRRIEAVSRVDWEVGSGETSELRVRIPAGWTVQLIEGMPEGSLLDWSIESEAAEGTVVKLEPHRPLPAEARASATLLLNGPELDAVQFAPPGPHSDRDRTPSVDASTAQFALPRVRPIGAHGAEEFVSIETGPYWAAELVDAQHLTTLAPEQAGSNSATAESASPVTHSSRLRYRIDGPEGGGRLILRRISGGILAQLSTEIELSAGVTRARYDCSFEDPSGQAEWFSIQFAPPVGQSLSWELPEGFLVERLERQSARQDAGEIWRVTVPAGHADAARIVAHWTAPTASGIAIPLASAAGGVNHQGRVTLTALEGIAVQATTNDLVPARTFDRPSARSGQTHAWHYAGSLPQLMLQIRPVSQPEHRESWIARTQLHTVLDAGGQAIHSVRYWVNAEDDITLAVQLPANASLRRITAAGHEVATSQGNNLLIPCLAGTSPCEVVVEYSTDASALERWHRLAFPLPQTPLRSLGFSWELELPAGYRPVAWSEPLQPSVSDDSASWAERLFGPIARRSRPGFFRFWETREWRDWWQSWPGTAQDELEAQLDAAFHDFSRQTPARQQRRWGELASTLDVAAGSPLLVDSIGLEMAGVTAHTVVGSDGTSSQHHLLRFLADRGLALLRTSHVLLLTTQAEASRMSQSAGSNARIKWIDRERLVRWVDQALLHGMDPMGRLVVVQSSLARHEFAAAAAPTAQRITGPSWSFRSLHHPSIVSVTLLRSLPVSHTTLLVALVWFLVILVRKCSRLSAQWTWCGAIAGASLTSAVMLPEGIAPTAAALGWSAVTIGLLCSIRAGFRANPSPTTAPRIGLPSTVSHTGAVSGLLLAAIAIPLMSSGQETNPTDLPAKYSPVFLPYDPKQSSELDKVERVLVPRPTMDRLLELGKPDGGIADQVLLQSAHYLGRVTQGHVELAIDLDLHSFASEDRPILCKVPLAGLVVRSAALDGRPCQLRPEPDGFAVEIRGSGQQQLHLDGVLSWDPAAAQGTMDLSIPPTPRSRLELEIDPGVEFRFARVGGPSPVPLQGKPARFVADLGGASRLSAQWQRSPLKPTVVRTELASLLSCGNAARRLEVRINLSVEAGLLDRLVIELDPRLVLDRVRMPGLREYRMRRSGDRLQLVLDLERPIEKPISLQAEFYLRESGDQTIAFPEVRVSQASSAVRWFAVRGEADSRVQVTQVSGLTSATLEEFLNVWGAPLARSGSMTVLRAIEESPRLELQVHPDLPKPAVQMNAEMRFGAGRIESSTRLSSSAGGSGSFHHELAIPPDLNLSDIRASRGTRWRIPVPGRLLWWGSSIDPDVSELEVHGWLTPPSAAAAVPLLHLQGDCQVTGELVIWSTRNGTLTLADLELMSATGRTPEGRAPHPGLLAHSVSQIESRDARAMYEFKVGKPRVSATIATRVVLEERSADWQSVVEYQISEGDTSNFQLRLPASFSHAVQLEGEGIVLHSSPARGSEVLWTLQLAEPRWDTFQVVLRARINQEADGRWLLPSVTPIAADGLHRYLMVVNASEAGLSLQGLEGQTVLREPDRGRWFPDAPKQSVLGAFELTDPPGVMEIVQQDPVQAAPEPLVILEEHRITLGASGTAAVESRLLTRSRGSQSLRMRRPPSSSLLGVWIDGQLAAPSQDPSGDQLLLMASEQQQFHEIVAWWTWDLADRKVGAPHLLRLPRLAVAAPQARCATTWQVLLAPGAELASAQPSPTSRSVAELLRARAIAGELSRMLQEVDQEAPPGNSVRQGRRALQEAMRTAEQTLQFEARIGLSGRQMRANHELATRQLDALARETEKLLERIDLSLEAVRPRSSTAERRERASNAADAPAPSLGTWPAGGPVGPPASGSLLYFATEGSQVQLAIRTASRLSRAPAIWVTAGLSGAAAAAAVVWLLRRWPRMGWVSFLAAAGALWCWKLRPEPLGPVLLLAAAAFGAALLIQVKYRPTQAAAGPKANA